MSSSKFNILVHLTAYADASDTNNPSLSNFRWNRDVQGLSISEPGSKSVTLPPGQSLSLFSGTVSTSADATTTWDIAINPLASNKYIVSHASGTAPAFRAARSEGHDATTTVTVTKNAKLLTFASSGGTAFSLIAGGVVVGDEVRVAGSFNTSNQGTFKILAVSATSFTVENETGVAEGPIALSAAFAEEVNIYGADGVQVGDKIDIVAGFSSVSFATYEITDVSHDFIEIFSNDSLPTESGVSNSPDAFITYRDAKQFLFIESDQRLDIAIDGSAITNHIVPHYAGSERKQGFFMSSDSLKSATITNTSQESACVFYITAE